MLKIIFYCFKKTVVINTFKNMIINPVIHPNYTGFQDEIITVLRNNDLNDHYLAKGTRNSIKIEMLSDGTVLTIKSFKIPNVVNKFVYRFFRESKAERSYTYALKLIELGFLTPHPIAYFENKSELTLKDSYYISELVDSELTYRELVTDENYPDRDRILEQFTHFSFQLHEKGIEFLDHSPGNTLIKKKDTDTYDFYLVDLNRMKFHEHMDFDTRMKNLSRLTPKREMIEKMSASYARLYNRSYEEVFEKMWQETSDFQDRFQTKQKRKKKLKAFLGIK